MAEEARECKLGPWNLKLVSIGDEISHAIAETQYPYKNGADLEDMGVNAELLRFSCVLTNDDYKENYQALRNWFLSYFATPIELIHPDHGTLNGYPQNVSFNNDRRKRFAQFDFEFKIAGIQPDIQDFTDPTEVCEEEAKAVNVEVQAALAEEMQRAGVPDVPGDDWSLLDYWGAMGDAARSFASGVSGALGRIQGVIETVKAPLDALNTTIDYVDTLSGSLTGSLQRFCDSLTALGRKAGSSSGTSVLASIFTERLASFIDTPVYASLATIAASTLACETARQISEDEVKMGESIAAESVVSDDAVGKPIAADTIEPFIMTPETLENSLAAVREFINRVLPVSKSPGRLKKMAATLTESILKLKMEYMTTRTVKVEYETPLHKILLDNGLNYKAAERVCALNNVKNPTFMKGEVLVYEQ
ncbi:MAG: DNA circularization N-terminal domain-containing protein [Fibrobacter sp.]|nr:DNA circularization N-terminal domain-containing protein [Fibrobacter sp.]